MISITRFVSWVGIITTWTILITSAEEYELDDSIVVNRNSQNLRNVRKDRQYIHIQPVPILWEYPISSYPSYENDVTTSGGSKADICTSQDGQPGTCITLEECSKILSLKSGEGDNSHSNLREEIYDSFQNGNCSSVVFAGKSKHANICCPAQKHVPQAPVTRPPFINSLYGGDSVDPQNYAATGCGMSSVPFLKIVNGTKTLPGEMPWMVALYGKSGKQTCGASLISETMVLTAAHCVAQYQPDDIPKLRLRLGDWNLKSAADGPYETRGILRIVKHKYFNINNFVNDIALLRMDKPMTFTSTIQPICLPSAASSGTRNLLNKQLLVAGWGRTSFNGPSSSELLKVGVRVWDNPSCDQEYKGVAPAGITSAMICAGDKGLDSCVGDSGGPLMHKVGPIYQQVGIVSFGRDCGKYPGVYTRISEFVSWINANRNK